MNVGFKGNKDVLWYVEVSIGRCGALEMEDLVNESSSVVGHHPGCSCRHFEELWFRVVDCILAWQAPLGCKICWIGSLGVINALPCFGD